MNATSMFWPSASSPRSVDAPSATTSPLAMHVADLDDRTLVDVGVLVGTGILDEVVDVDADLARLGTSSSCTRTTMRLASM